MPTYCSVYGCLNSSVEKPGLSFFKVPTDTERRTKWLQLISREDLNDRNPKYYRVCEEHFRVQDKLPSNNRLILKRSAVPSLYLPQFTKNGDETDVTLAPVENCLQTVKVTGSNDDSDEDIQQKLRKKRSYEEEEIDSEVEDSNKDVCKRFSDYVTEKLAKYNEHVRNQVEDRISKILNEADLGYYDSSQNANLEPSTSVLPVTSDLSSSSAVTSTTASRPSDANKNNLMLVNTVETDLAYVQVVKRRFK